MLDNINVEPIEIKALLKIGKKCFQEKIYKEGQFFLCQSAYFREKALKEDGHLVGDIHESSFPRNYTFEIGELSFSPFCSDDDDSQAITLETNTCIFCFYAIPSDNLNKKTYTIPKSLLKGIIGEDHPSDYEIIVFTDPQKTISKIKGLLDKLSLTNRIGKIHYDDHQFLLDPSLFATNINQAALELSFHKCKKYEGQKEFRIAAVNPEDGSYERLTIGKLSDNEYFVLPINDTDHDIDIYFPN